MGMRHHTADKGDVGVVKVIDDLICNGINVCLPLSEHLPFDLIAVSPCGLLKKVQVKYAKLDENNTIYLPLRRCYNSGRGAESKTVDRSLFDCFAVYCPDIGTVLYVRCDEIPTVQRNAFKIRVGNPRNNQWKKVNRASCFEGADRIFKPDAVGVEGENQYAFSERPRSSDG